VGDQGVAKFVKRNVKNSVKRAVKNTAAQRGEPW
jgi:hypothetical protein